jgi:hypothetical protein
MTVRVFATKWFARYARKHGLSDKDLCRAVTRAEKGSIDAELGGNLIKQRVARGGRGRSSGYRTLIAHRRAECSVFLYGFAKNERESMDARELRNLRALAGHLLGFDDSEIRRALAAGELTELYEGDEEENG